MPWTGEDFTGKTAVRDIAGWTTDDATYPRIMGDGDAAGVDVGSVVHWMERTLDHAGDLTYYWFCDFQDQITVHVDGVLVATHYDSDEGENTLTGLTSVAVVRFTFTTDTGDCWVDDLVQPYTAPPAIVIDSDVIVEIDSPALGVNWSLAVNSIDVNVESVQPAVGINYPLAINSIDVLAEIDSPSVAVNFGLDVNSLDVPVNLTPVNVKKAADLALNEPEVRVELETPVIGVNWSITVDSIDVVTDATAPTIGGSKTLAVDSVDVLVESESPIVATNHVLTIDSVDVGIETTSPRVVLTGSILPRRSRLFVRGGAMLATPHATGL